MIDPIKVLLFDGADATICYLNVYDCFTSLEYKNMS